jgi:hypothetical protein
MKKKIKNSQLGKEICTPLSIFIRSKQTKKKNHHKNNEITSNKKENKKKFVTKKKIK